jgi:hypothetical protein
MPRSLLVWLLAVLPLGALAGCQSEEPAIESYTVAQPNREKLRMLTAIVPGEKMAFFVKLAGPEETVAGQLKPFNDFVGSLKINEQDQNAPLAWKTPDGWKERPGGGQFRLASFRIEAARPIEVAVTYGSADTPLLDNVNRWRGQINLPLAEPAELDRLISRSKVDGRELILVDMTGTGVYQRPAAAQAHAAPRDPHAGLPMLGGGKLGKAKLPFQFTPQAGWQPLRPLPMFAVEAYQVVDGNSQATITISSVGGSVVENVKRWRTDQLQLPAAPAGELQKSLRPIRLAGQEAQYVDLVNPALNGPANRILGVILPGPDANWIIKMTGPEALVGRQKASFEAFVASFQPARE